MSLLAACREEAAPTLRLAAPIVIGQVSQMLMGVTDSVMIGRTGTVPLAASAFGGNVFSIFYVLGIGLMIPVAILVSRARGAERPEEAGEYLRHGLALAFACGLLETLLMGLVGTQLPRLGQPPEVLAIVMPFYLLLAASITPVLVYLVLRQFAEAMGRPWVPMFIMLAGVGLNALLNWIFIYGHLGAPALGLTGAAISTLISRSIGAGVVFLWLRFDPAVRPAWPRRWLGWLVAGTLRRIAPAGRTGGRDADVREFRVRGVVRDDRLAGSGATRGTPDCDHLRVTRLHVSAWFGHGGRHARQSRGGGRRAGAFAADRVRRIRARVDNHAGVRRLVCRCRQDDRDVVRGGSGGHRAGGPTADRGRSVSAG
jgi:hypothetical protein